MFYIDLLELYFKKYTLIVKASDYVDWAYNNIESDIIEVKKLASMSIKKSLNIFEIEEMFEAVIKTLQQDEPSEEQCFDYHINQLHSQLLLPDSNVISIVKEIYTFTIQHELFEEQMNWQEISDVIDEYQYGDTYNDYTKDNINEMIVEHARRIWTQKKK